MRINVHAGHNPAGKIACGAVGFINESTENRRVVDEIISQLRQLGHTVYDCTVNDGVGQRDVLKKIVQKCKMHEADLDVSIHFNSGANDKTGNGKTTGTEVYVYSASSKAYGYADKICKAIANIGFKNRGVKVNPNLYFLKHVTAPALLVECCFVDDKDDVQLYNYQDVASAIVYGITGQIVQKTETESDKATDEESSTGDRKALYRVQVGAYSRKENAQAQADKLKKAGFDAVVVQA